MNAAWQQPCPLSLRAIQQHHTFLSFFRILGRLLLIAVPVQISILCFFISLVRTAHIQCQEHKNAYAAANCLARYRRKPGPMAEPVKIKNVSAWKLNKAEQRELESRVAGGESEQDVKRQLQQAKAEASLARKQSATAVAEKSQKQVQAMQAKPKKRAAGGSFVPQTSEHRTDSELNDATNREYYALVQQDLETILNEFGSDLTKAAPLTIGAGVESGVQEVYCHVKAATSFSQHGVYRASVSAFWLNALSPSTPGIPMARKRAEDLSLYTYGPSFEPRFTTDRMIEIACSDSDLTPVPNNLQMVSPEELLHSMLHACAAAIRLLALNYLPIF